MTPQEAERNLAVLVADVRLLFTRYFNRRASRLGLTTPQWLVLSALYRRDGLTQTELAETLDMGKSPLGKLVDKLEEGDWVRRVADPQDRRVNRVELTNRLTPLMSPLAAVSEEMKELATAGLDEAEVEALLDALTAMKRNLGSAVAETLEPVEFPTAP
jgi:DNA-binding MarR family transcriptional regulator